MLLIEGVTLNRSKSKGLVPGGIKAMELTANQRVALEQLSSQLREQG